VTDRCDKCGQKLQHPRNEARHKLFFAVLKPAFDQWPEQYEFQPENEEHLRAWLLTKAGHNTADNIETHEGIPESVIPALTIFINSMATGKPRFLKRLPSGQLRIYKPKSIAYDKCDEATFKSLFDKCVEIIVSVVGVPIEELKRQNERAA